MVRHVADLDVKIRAIDRQLLEQHKANETSQRLAAFPGIGPITAIAMALSVNPASFESGRHFAAWLGLTPKEHSRGGKHRLGRISKAGNERLRQLLVVGAMMSFGQEKIPDEIAYECAEHISRLFMSYGILLRNESFDELEGIIQEYMQEVADRLGLPRRPP